MGIRSRLEACLSLFPWYRRRAREADLARELRGHLELEGEEQRAAGLSPEEAAHAAQRALGNTLKIEEDVRTAWGFAWVEVLFQDLRYGLRMLRKSPGFIAVAVLTLGLGIGANTAIFSVVDWLLLRPLPVSHPSQVTVLAFQQKKGPIETQFSYPEFQDLRRQTTSVFSAVLGYAFGIDGLSVNGKAERVLTAYVTGNYFTALGLRPVLGRLILPSEGWTAGADPYLVLGYSYWQTHFGGDPGVIGKQVEVDGHPITIVGVAPEGFDGLSSVIAVQAYLPYGMRSVEAGLMPLGRRPAFLTSRDDRSMRLFSRLKAGVTLDQAQAVLNVVSERLSAEHPRNETGLSVQAYREQDARPSPDPQHTTRTVSILFMTLAALVLLLACVNVANLLLVRATTREREMAVRTALGAGRGRLVRQLLTESVVLALLGGVAGVLLGMWGVRILRSIRLGTSLPLEFNLGLDWRVLSFALAAALATGVVVGIVPALRASRASPGEVLHEGGRTGSARRHRLRSGLVVAQVAGSLMLLVVAGLFTRSLGKAQSINLGFDPSHVVNLTMDLNYLGYSEAEGRSFYNRLLDRARALPGVSSASLAFTVPMGYYSDSETVQVQGYQPPPGQPPPMLRFNLVTPGYFKTLRIPIIRGRTFTDADNRNAPDVAIVNQAMAGRFWPHEDPTGREFAMGNGNGRTIRIVGIVKNSRVQHVIGPHLPYFYLVQAQHYHSLETLQVRSTAAPAAVIHELESQIQTLAPGLPVFDVQTMPKALDTLNGFLMFRLGAGLAAVLGGLGLVLALVGVYGVMSYSTSQRTHEIGIRMALGARPVDVLETIFRQGLAIIGTGVALGVAFALAVSRLAANFLVGVSPTDPLTYVSVCVGLIAVGLASCYIPARRAAHADPVVALRQE